MDDYVKVIKLKPALDNESVKEIKKTMDAMGQRDAIKEKLSMTNDLLELEKQITKLKQQGNKSDVEELEYLSKRAEYIKQIIGIRSIKQPTTTDKFKDELAKSLKSIANSFLVSLKGLLTDSWRELQNMLSYGLLSNENVRDIRMTYGLSSSQAYGLSKAENMLGIDINSDDLFYMNATERKKFFEIMTKYSEEYSKLYDEGFFNTMLEYNIEMKNLKQELQMDVISFFVSNKDLIKTALEFEMNSLEKIMSWVSKIANWFGVDTIGAQASRASDIMNSYSSKNIAVKIDNTFNTTNETNQSKLVNIGEQTYAGLIKMLKEF